MPKVFLGLGSNLGNRLRNLEKAVLFLQLHDEIELLRVSKFIENPAVDGAGPNDFLNGVIMIQTSLSPRELLKYILKIESSLGRAPRKKASKIKLPRTIDIDILLYDDLILEEKDLNIPHPRMLERDFVMKPLLEIEPYFEEKFSNKIKLALSSK